MPNRNVRLCAGSARLMSLSSLFVCIWLLASASVGRATGFTTNDLYLLGQDLPTIHGGILRIDPTSGATTVLYDVPGQPKPTFTYDAWRDRLVFALAVSPGGLTAVDANGTTTSLAPSMDTPDLVAARGDGILYFWYAAIHGFRYLDATGVDHDLLDQTGAARLDLDPNSTPDELIYDGGTNSLVCFDGTDSHISYCSDPTKVCAIRIPLTADGGQVAAALQSVQVFISNTGDAVEGSGYAPGGKILWEVDTNTNAEEPRVQELDPATMTSITYASPGPYEGAAASNGGTYSHARGQAVIVDTFSDELRAFSFGEAGNGTPFSSGVSSDCCSGELDRLVEIRPASLAGVAGPMPGVPRGWALEAVGANPFRGATELALDAPVAEHVTITIHDAAGRRVRTVADAQFAAGRHLVSWDGRDANGAAVPPGIYFARLQATGVKLARKLLLVR